MASDREFSWYAEKLLKSKFPQFDLLCPDDFVRHLRERDIDVRVEDLEFLENKKILLPVLRLNRPKSNHPHRRYSAVNLSTSGLQACYNEGLVEFPESGDFKPWKKYRDGYEEKTWLFYHPFQSVFLHRIQYFRHYNPNRIRSIVSSVPWWNKKIGLLMLLQEPYQPQSVGSFKSNILEPDASYGEWLKWRQEKFKAKSILKLVGLSVDEIKQWYEHLAVTGYNVDPLADWFVLTKIIRRSRKRKLKGKALLAQDYYEMAKLVDLFLVDLTGQKQKEPDDVMDSRNGAWKPDIFGDPFDYTSKATRRAIAEYYLLPQFIRLIILVEGPTEEKVISMIFNALYINPEHAGIMLRTYDGIDNLRRKNINDLLELANEDQIPAFVIADSENNARNKLETLIVDDKIKQGMYRIWNGDFEQDNFGVSRVIKAANNQLRARGKKIDEEKVRNLMKNQSLNLMLAVSTAYREKYRQSLDKVISKPTLAEALFKNRAKEIRREYNKEGHSKNKRPIEKVLQQLFELIPEYG